MQPRAIILAGYGLNCEEETKFAFERAGAAADIVHLADLVADKRRLSRYQILAIPGGFSFGDDTGSGKAYANKMRNTMREELDRFIGRDTLTLGICNGFQILTNLGLLPGALLANDSARYIDRWVDLEVVGESPWLKGLGSLSLPIAHGEGKYYAPPHVLYALGQGKQIGMKYVKGEISTLQNLPANPNGALEDIACVTGAGGRVLGMMPHPERGMFFTQQPHWTLLKEKYARSGNRPPKTAAGLKMFENAVKYFL